MTVQGNWHLFPNLVFTQPQVPEIPHQIMGPAIEAKGKWDLPLQLWEELSQRVASNDRKLESLLLIYKAIEMEISNINELISYFEEQLRIQESYGIETAITQSQRIKELAQRTEGLGECRRSIVEAENRKIEKLKSQFELLEFTKREDILKQIQTSEQEKRSAFLRKGNIQNKIDQTMSESETIIRHFIADHKGIVTEDLINEVKLDIHDIIARKALD